MPSAHASPIAHQIYAAVCSASYELPPDVAAQTVEQAVRLQRKYDEPWRTPEEVVSQALKIVLRHRVLDSDELMNRVAKLLGNDRLPPQTYRVMKRALVQMTCEIANRARKGGVAQAA